MSQPLSEGEPHSKRPKIEDQEQGNRPTTRTGRKKDQERLTGGYSQKTDIATTHRDMDIDAVTSPQVGATINPVAQIEVQVPQNPQMSGRTRTSESTVQQIRATNRSQRQSAADDDGDYCPDHRSSSMSDTAKPPQSEPKPGRKPRVSKKNEKLKLYGGTHEQEIKRLQHIIAVHEVEKAMLQSQKKDLESKEKLANKELKAYKKKTEDLEKESGKLRTVLSKLSTDHGPPAEDDDIVRSKFQKMFEAFKDWSERHAITSFDEVEDGLLESLRDDIAKVYSDRASNSHTGIISKAMWSKGGRILLSSLLGIAVVEKFLKRPFFFLEKFDSYGKLPIETEPVMHGVFRFLERRHQQKAHAWRAATLKLLTELEGGSGREKHKILDLRNRFCFDFTQTFLDNPMVTPLLQAVDEAANLSRHTELCKIVESAEQFACELWKQKSFMAFQDKHLYSMQFYRSSPGMRPHPGMLLHEDNKKFDSRTPDMVIFPGIKAQGNEKGENYNTSKTWFSPVVYLFDDPKVEETRVPERPPSSLAHNISTIV